MKSAREEFPDQTISWDEVADKHGGKVPEGKILLQDTIADIIFQKMLLRPSEFDVIATHQPERRLSQRCDCGRSWRRGDCARREYWR